MVPVVSVASEDVSSPCDRESCTMTTSTISVASQSTDSVLYGDVTDHALLEVCIYRFSGPQHPYKVAENFRNSSLGQSVLCRILSGHLT